MSVQGWSYYKHGMIPNTWPHEDVNLTPIKDGTIWNVHGGGTPLFARWTSEWDCEEETQFYYCIKDDGFNLSSLKAKRRYEINKGNKNFETRIIDPKRYVNEIYAVYLESLKGYSFSVTPETRDAFQHHADSVWSTAECIFFGVFDRETGELCGYSDVYERGLYLPISSLKTRVDCEKRGVNFALVSGIVEWYLALERAGSYLCDGARNIFHQTCFQEFLIKYFGFRKAYCKLNVVYRPIAGVMVKALFPVRHMLARVKNRNVRMVCAILKMEAWKRGLPD